MDKLQKCIKSLYVGVVSIKKPLEVSGSEVSSETKIEHELNSIVNEFIIVDPTSE